MPPQQPYPPPVRIVAARQAEVISRDQALSHGLSRHVLRRLVEAGTWRRLCPGMFFTLPIEPPWLAWAWAGILIGGDRARIGGLAALHLAGVTDSAPELIRVLVRGDTRPRVDGPWRFRRDRPGFREAIRVGAPPRTSTADAVLDVVAEAADRERVVGWVTDAVQSRRVSADQLRRRLEARSRQPHRALLAELLIEVGEGVRSPLELRYRRDVERAHGLPTGQRQVARRGTRCDVWYVDYGTIVELDGRRGHEGTGAFRDMRRDNSSTTDGLATLRYGYHDVFGSPCAVAAQVAANLGRRGWTGQLAACRQCRPAA